MNQTRYTDADRAALIDPADINRILMHPDKNTHRRFLKKLVANLDSEDVVSSVRRLIIVGNPVAIKALIYLMLCLYMLRAEIISWETEHRRSGLSAKQYARIALKECPMNFNDVDAGEVMKFVDYIRGGVEEGAIDYYCGLVDAVYELRDELIAGERYLPSKEPCNDRRE